MHTRNFDLRLIGILLVTWAAAAGVGCGGGDDRSQDSNPSGGTSLEWDQRADSLQQAQTLTFKLYVDKVPRVLSNARCRSTNRNGTFVCSAPLPQLGPGRHTIQLASVMNGVESPLSEPLVLPDSAGQLATEQTSASPAAAAAVSCIGDSTTDCYNLRRIASGLNDVSALSATSDGRLFFVEGGWYVRVAVDGALVPEPALALTDDRARIVDLAMDPASTPDNTFAFVAWIEQAQSGHATLNVTRYREVANALGEGATILTGIPVPIDRPASIALDGDGLIYVAVPALDPSAPSGVILRLTRDGRVPPENRLGLPSFTHGFSTPSSLSLDSERRLLWLAGRESSGDYAIGIASVLPSEADRLPSVVARVTSDEPVSLLRVKGERADQSDVFVVANGNLAKAHRAPDGSIRGYLPLDLGDMRVATAAATRGGWIYVATKTSVFLLFPR